MKKTILTLCAALMLCLAGRLAAQNNLEQRQMEAFRGLTETIPYQPASGLSAYTDLSQKMNLAVKAHPLSENAALQKALKESKIKAAKASGNKAADSLAVDTVLNNTYWGVLSSAEDGTQLFVTMEYIPSGEWFLGGVTYTLFDENFKPGKSFSLEVPARTQDISLMTSYSTKFFNINLNKEFLVSVHSFAEGQTGPESCRDTLFVIDEDGEILRSFGHTSGAMLHIKPIDELNSEYRVQMVDAFYSGLADTMKTSVYKARDLMKDNPTPLFTFSIPENLTTYANGVLAAFTEIEGEPCYVTTQYTKPFVVDNDHSGEEIIVEKDNSYEVYIYDIDFHLLKKITLPLFGLEENDLSFSTLMYFGKYMITRHTFNKDDKYELIYGMDRYDISCDCGKLQFYLVDEDGNILNEIVDGVASVTELSSVIGQEDEFALALGSEDAVTGISMLGMPSLNINITFPALYRNELLSMSFDRVAAEQGGYNYVFGLGRGESADSTVYGGIIYYDREGNTVKRHRIDLGEDCLLFTPIINGLTMNPYAFIPDEKQEYIYFYRFSKNDAAGKGFGIANEDTTLYKWQDNDSDGSFYSAGILNNQDGTELKDLYVTWDNDGSMNHVFYRLPLKDIELNGQGTQASPYIITTPAELDRVRNHPEAWFVLGNDIDMGSFTGVDMKGFNPIPEFTGHLDGKGHFITNLTLNGSGLFGSVQEGAIANLSLRNVAFSTKRQSYTGTMAGSLRINATLTNCHVEGDLVMNGDCVGGLVGWATNFAVMDRCSFTGSISGSSESVGGLVGDMRTGATVKNSCVKGSVAGKKNVGGIVGSMLNDPVVENSYSSASVYASAYAAGGIVGYNKGGHIQHTYATGKVEVDTLSDSRWEQGVAGGIAGFTTPSNFKGQIKYTFALNDTVTATKNTYRVAMSEYYKSGADSIKSLDSNFALSSMKIGPRASLSTVSDAATCVKDRNNGESGSMETFNQAFYEKYTWAFGNDAAAPWQMNGTRPALWWETLVRGLGFPSRQVTVGRGKTVTLTANIIPADAVNKTLIWSSADPKVATVDQQGVVTGRSVGKTDITVKTPDGLYSASCEVSVIIPVEQVLFAKKEMYVPVDCTVPLTVSVLPEDATDRSVLYLSLDPSVALTGGPAVYGVSTGTTQIVAVSEQSGVSDTCTVHVQMAVVGIVLNENAITLNRQTPTFQLVASIYPEEAADVDLLWTSDNPRVATVSETGLVSAHEQGEAMVTVSPKVDETSTAICFVTVTESVSMSNEDAGRDVVAAYAADGEIVVKASCGMEWLRIYNLSGVCVAERATSGADRMAVDAARLPQGLYLLQVGLSGGRTVHTKVMR